MGTYLFTTIEEVAVSLVRQGVGTLQHRILSERGDSTSSCPEVPSLPFYLQHYKAGSADSCEDQCCACTLTEVTSAK